MNWSDYEKTVRNIYEQLGQSKDVTIECYGNKCQRVGKSTVSHNIDVLASHTDGIHKYFTAIECKYWNKKINKDIVMKVEAIVKDCNFSRGVIVTKKGFTPDGINYAKYSNVDLVELYEYRDNSNTIAENKLFLNSEITATELERIEFKMNKNDVNNKDFMPLQDKYRDYLILDNNGSSSTINEIVLNFLNKKVLKTKLFEIIEDILAFPENTNIVYDINGYQFPILSLTMRGYIIQYTHLDFDYIENKVTMIMKGLFQQKEYILSHDGVVEEMKKSPLKLFVGQNIKFKANFRTK